MTKEFFCGDEETWKNVEKFQEPLVLIKKTLLNAFLFGVS